jgi:hypothetical protein
MSTPAKRPLVTIHLPASVSIVSSIMLVVAETYPEATLGYGGTTEVVFIEIPEEDPT